MEGESDGVITRAVDQIFAMLRAQKERGLLTDEPEVRISCVELYRDMIIDMLNPGNFVK